ncbi:uncharacterized protein LOC111888612 [Lactuca sativa]|uniref:uncharacterized protein LOC111888612 n=1 Tax=Lactuca sativa TaxID=4236 RepID=UPI000CAD7989|nr:uncharacterized protein LOC111888612 [Lactuca sativa]
MVKTRSMTRNESKKRFKTCDDDDDDPAPWSDLNHELLFTVMMQLGVVDFPAFSGVCKSWRSFALSNKNKFMQSRPPISISIFSESNDENFNYYLDDINTEGRSFNSILPQSGGRTCVGFTCGHLILFGSKTHDFWLLDPVTKHGVYFPNIPSSVSENPAKIRGFLVFSRSKSEWVFVMTDGSTNIWYSISGEGEWNHVSSTSPIVDLRAFNGKMYAMDNARHLCELTINPEPKLLILETKNFPNFPKHQQFYKSRENLCVMGYFPEGYYYEYHKLDFEEMKWVLFKTTSNTTGASSIRNNMKPSGAVKHGKSKFFIWNWKHMVYPKID